MVTCSAVGLDLRPKDEICCGVALRVPQDVLHEHKRVTVMSDEFFVPVFMDKFALPRCVRELSQPTLCQFELISLSDLMLVEELANSTSERRRNLRSRQQSVELETSLSFARPVRRVLDIP